MIRRYHTTPQNGYALEIYIDSVQQTFLIYVYLILKNKSIHPQIFYGEEGWNPQAPPLKAILY